MDDKDAIRLVTVVVTGFIIFTIILGIIVIALFTDRSLSSIGKSVVILVLIIALLGGLSFALTRIRFGKSED